MSKVNNFLRTSLFGGIVILLPILVLFIMVRWLYQILASVIYPLTSFIVEKTALQQMIADMIVIATILLICFLIGALVKTRLGTRTFRAVEDATLGYAPGYNIIKETIMLFFGRNKSPFSAVALVRPFLTETLMTAFVTDDHPDGSHTVFIPTAPNPTSGNIYHLPDDRVYIIDVPIDEALRSILSCGIGSTNMILKAKEIREKKKDWPAIPVTEKSNVSE